MVLTDILYAVEHWSLTLRKARTLRVFGKRFLRKVFGPTREYVTMEIA